MAINSDEILKAIANLEKCIELWKQIDQEYERKDDYYRDICSLAIWKTKLGEIKEADNILKKVEGHISRNNVDAIMISRTYIERGNILLRTNNLSAAEIMLTENIKKYEELVGSSAMSDIHLMFIECLIRNNKLSEALEIINLYSDDNHAEGARRLNSILMLYHRGIIEYRERERDKSIRTFKEFIEKIKTLQSQHSLEHKNDPDLFNLDGCEAEKLLEKSCQILSNFYNPQHPFIQQYVSTIVS